jgi:hypothetical protein
MPAILPNTPTVDDYPGAGSGGCQVGMGDVFKSGYFVVANAAAFAEYQHGIQGQQDLSNEIYLPPATYPLVGTDKDPLGGIHFRSAVVGVPAQVFGVLYKKDESALLAGSEFSSTIASSGAITPPSGGSTLNRVTALPGAAGDGDAIIIAPDSVTYPGLEWAFVYNVATGYWDALGEQRPIYARKDGGPFSEGGFNNQVYGNTITDTPVTIPAFVTLGDFNVELRGMILPASTLNEGTYFSYSVAGVDRGDTFGIQAIELDGIAQRFPYWGLTDRNEVGIAGGTIIRGRKRTDNTGSAYLGPPYGVFVRPLRIK